MMRHVLPLHDLSRMDVTVFIILEQQLYNAQQPENKHILGEVQIRNIGRGPPVTRFWDARCSSSCSVTRVVMPSCDEAVGCQRVSRGR